MIAFISGVVFALIVVALLLWRTIVIVNQASSAIIERIRRHQHPDARSGILVPFVDQFASEWICVSKSPRSLRSR